MKVRKINIKRLSPELYKKLWYLNMGSGGLMRGCLEDTHQYKQNYYAAYAYYIEKENKILSWALVLKYSNKQKESLAQYYTRARYRGRGLASKLAEQIKKDTNNRCLVNAWDKRSLSFFAKHYPNKKLKLSKWC